MIGAPKPDSASRRPLVTVLVAAVTLAVFLCLMAADFAAPGFAMDEGMVLVYPELILQGRLPYRDFESFYGPLNLWVLAGAYASAGAHLLTERGVGAMYHVAILLGVFALGLRGGRVTAVGGMLLAWLFLSIVRLTALAWLGGVACALWAVIALSGAKPWRSFLAGVLGAAALLFRPDLGPAVLLSAAPLLWRLSWSARVGWLGGIVVGLSPLAWLAVTAGAAEIFDNLFRYPVLISNPGRHLPWSAGPSWAAGTMLLHFAGCAVLFLAATLARRRPERAAQAPLLLAAGLLALGLTHQGMQRADYVHLATTAFLAIALLPWALGEIVFRNSAAETLPIYRLAVVAAALGLLAASAVELMNFNVWKISGAFTGEVVEHPRVRMDGREFVLASRSHAEGAQQVIDVLKSESRPGERLFVGGANLRRAYANDTFLYHLAPWLEPATYFLEMNPFSANRPDSRLAADVASADWVVLNRLWDRWQEPNASGWLGPDAPNEIVRTQFESRGRFGTFELFQRRVAADVTARR